MRSARTAATGRIGARAAVVVASTAYAVACGGSEFTSNASSGGSSGASGASSGGGGSGGTSTGGSGGLGSGGSGGAGGSGASGGSGGGGGASGAGGSGAAGGTAGAGGSGASGGSAGTGASSGTGGSGPVTTSIELTATVADCVASNAPNPDTCLTAYPTELHVDLYATGLASSPSVAYLRFEVGSQIAGASIEKTELVLYNVNGSDQSGVVHQVPTFTRQGLFGSAPAPGAVIANDLGLVAANTEVTWSLSLPPSASQPYCVAVTATTDDGIGYARLGSATPPKLRITYTK